MIKKLFIALCLAVVLSACAHTAPVINSVPPVQISDVQWDCSPRPNPLPDDAGLAQMKSYDLFMRYKDAYLWGDRCSKLLQDNKEALEKELTDRYGPSPAQQKPLR